MINNTLKIILRGFRKQKLFTFINILGLSIGISAALVIYLIIHYDLNFDKQHKHADRIYRVVTNFTFAGTPASNPGVCGPLTQVVKSEVSGLEEAVPFFRLFNLNVHIAARKGDPRVFKLQKDIILADSNYFKLFDYTWLAGSPNSALHTPFEVVLTADQADKYFPGMSYKEMLGKTVVYDSINTTVTGIVQPLAQNSDLIFHDFISYTTAFSNKDLKAGLRLNNWGGTGPESQLFLRLMPGITAAQIEKQLNAILRKNNPANTVNTDRLQSFMLQPLGDIHSNPLYGTFNGRVADKTTMVELLVIAVFLLVLGCINFINLSTAQSIQRAKEIGIRKTLGSNRRQLIIQFLSETFVITLIAVIISALLAPVILKLFSSFIPPGITVDFMHQPDLFVFLAALAVLVSILAGSYPALILSGYQPVSVLKNQVKNKQGSSRNVFLRKTLTVTQFIIAQFFIIATFFVSKQIYYALHKDLGFKKDAVVIINSPGKNRTTERNRVFANKLRAIPGVELVSLGHDAPTSDNPNSTEGTFRDGKKEIKIENLGVKFGDENYIKVYHIPLLAGRNLQTGDVSKGFLINQSLAKLIGFNDPHDAVGKSIDNYNGDTKMQIVGVVGDFYQESIHERIAPLAILTSTEGGFNGTFHLALKQQTANGGEWKTSIAAMEKAWKEIYPEDDFEFHFFDETIARLYAAEQKTSTLLGYATFLSILISCLGLLGLALYTTHQRTKEIGVRKVLGASVIQIVRLLTGEMIILIVLALVLVIPVAWWAMNKWMQNYADHTGLSWWVFAASGAGMIVCALLTSGFQTIQAARANPAKSLKTE